jgi:WD40 repeat protein
MAFDNYVFPFTIPAHSNGIKCMAISHVANNILLTGGYDRLLKIWDISNGGKRIKARKNYKLMLMFK